MILLNFINQNSLSLWPTWFWKRIQSFKRRKKSLTKQQTLPKKKIILLNSFSDFRLSRGAVQWKKTWRNISFENAPWYIEQEKIYWKRDNLLSTSLFPMIMTRNWSHTDHKESNIESQATFVGLPQKKIIVRIGSTDSYLDDPILMECTAIHIKPSKNLPIYFMMTSKIMSLFKSKGRRIHRKKKFRRFSISARIFLLLWWKCFDFFLSTQSWHFLWQN